MLFILIWDNLFSCTNCYSRKTDVFQDNESKKEKADLPCFGKPAEMTGAKTQLQG